MSESKQGVEDHQATRAELKAKAEAAKTRRAERLAKVEAWAAAKAQRRSEAKASARAAEKLEAADRARARAEAHAAAKAAEAARAKERRDAKAATAAAQASAPDLTGRQRLIDAAVRLHGERRSFASLGIREIAREANLNPNTFYRHFESIDDLAVAAIAQVGERLRPMLHQIHRLASRVDPGTVAALEVNAFYAFALGNPDAFVVGVTEYHAGSPRVRESIAALLNDIASELRDDIAELGLFPMLTRDRLDMACNEVVRHLFHLSQEYIEKAERRDYIVEASENMIVWMFAGAALATPANLAALYAAISPKPAG